MRKTLPLLLLCTVLSLNTACDDSKDDERAESGLRFVLQLVDSSVNHEQTVALADSLERADVLSAPQADLLRGLCYDRGWQMRLAEYYYKKAYEALSADPGQDWVLYAESGYRLIALRTMRLDLQGALSAANDIMDSAEGNPEFPLYYKSAVLSTIAECQSKLHQNDEAKQTYRKNYEVELQLSGGEGKGSFNQLVTCLNISNFYSSINEYDEATLWLKRCDNELLAYEQHGNPLLVEEWKGHIALNWALLYQHTGRAKEAAEIFDAIPESRIFNPPAISDAFNYLMAAGRYDEAADCIARLDSTYMTTDGAQMTFDNISTRLIPRYIANRKAGRNAYALIIGDSISAAIDSALVWQQKNDAVELAVIYKTHEKELALEESRAKAAIYQILTLAAFLLILLLCYIMLRIHRYNRQLAEKNHSLYEQIQQHKQDEAEKMNTLQAKPEEDLTSDQRIYRRLCTLMSEKQPYTDESLNRDSLAQLLGTNAKYVDQAIHECSHSETTGSFINRYRLEHVARMLKDTDYPVNIIGEMAGIPSRATLARLFRNTYGMTCSEYRQIAKKQ